MYDFCQPTIGASLKAKLIKTRPATPVRAPGRSNLTHHFGLGPVLRAGGVRLLSAGNVDGLLETRFGLGSGGQFLSLTFAL